MRSLITPLVITTCLTLFGCGEKYALDKQMEELCKKDGGVKVFEQVKLPASRFDKEGTLLPETPYKEGVDKYTSLLGKDYRYVVRYETIKAGNSSYNAEGRLERYIEEIYRLSDNKLLGSVVSYGRSGGDSRPMSFLGGHPSSNYCPKPSYNLIKSMFIKGE
jgi:hypothetical protein